MLNENKTPFKNLTDAEKGELLLAIHRRLNIQYWDGHRWVYDVIDRPSAEIIYRSSPAAQKVTLFGQDFGNDKVWVFTSVHATSDTDKLTFDIVDDKLCNPVFEKLEEE